MPDSSEMISALAGNPEIYRQVVHRFQGMAFGYAYSLLGDRHLAEDAVQEAFAEAYVNIRGLKDPAAFPGWFRRIVQRRCARFTRRNRVDTVQLDAAWDIGATDPTPLDSAVRREAASLLRAAIASLPSLQREITALLYLGHSSVADISGFLELPVGTVKHQLYLARQTLRQRMMTMRLPRVASLAPHPGR